MRPSVISRSWREKCRGRFCVEAALSRRRLGRAGQLGTKAGPRPCCPPWQRPGRRTAAVEAPPELVRTEERLLLEKPSHSHRPALPPSLSLRLPLIPSRCSTVDPSNMNPS